MKPGNENGNASSWRSAATFGPKRVGFGRAVALSVLFAFLFLTGLYLEFLAVANWRAGEIVLWLHIGAGLILVALFASWICAHVARGLPHSARPLFTWLSWLLLADYLTVLITGLAMVAPAALFLGGRVWFFRFETTGILTFLHLWCGVAAMPGVLVHLALRHWQIAASPSAGGKS